MFELKESSKRLLVAWLWEELSQIDFSSFYEPFSANADVAGFFKRKGYQVLCSNILQSGYWWGKALVENNEETLTPDFLAVMSDTSRLGDAGQDFQAWAEHYFTAEETQYLGLWWHNIHYSSDFSDNKRALAYTVIYHILNYWLSFNKSYLKPKPLSPSELLTHYGDQVNRMVYNNEMPNRSYYTDAYSIVDELATDVVLISPPSADGFRQADLRTYLAECWTRRTTQLNLESVITPDSHPKLGENFEHQMDNYLAALSNFLGRCANNQLWVVVHRDRLGVSLTDVDACIRQYRPVWKTASFEIPYPAAGGTQTFTESILMAVAE